MGLRTAPMAELILQDCHVPEQNQLGQREDAPGPVFSVALWSGSGSCILASHVGAMRRQLETCIKYARERRQFGQPIGKFQSVSNRIADMQVRLETARLILSKVAWLKKTVNRR